MMIDYRSSIALTAEVHLDEDEQFMMGGLRVASLRLGENSIAITGHLVLGDGTVDPKPRINIVYRAGLRALPDWVQDLHEGYTAVLAECVNMIEAHVEKAPI